MTQIRLLHPAKPENAEERPLLVFLPVRGREQVVGVTTADPPLLLIAAAPTPLTSPFTHQHPKPQPTHNQGTDGTGQAILPQVPGLLSAGFDVRSLYIPPDDRSGWADLQSNVIQLLAAALQPRAPARRHATVVAESFGGCLALRVALAAPELVGSLVLLNPATSFAGSLGGLSSVVSATNLLALFPKDLYTTAQTVMMPLLVRAGGLRGRGAGLGFVLIRRMRSLFFSSPPPPSFSTLGIGFHGANCAKTTTQTSTTLTTTSTHASALPQVDNDRVGRAGADALRSMLFMEPPFDFDDPFLSQQQQTQREQQQEQRARRQQRGAGGLPFPFPFPLPAPFSGGGDDGELFGPAAAANFRANLMRDGNLADSELQRVGAPTLVVCSARDRMLPSLAEGGVVALGRAGVGGLGLSCWQLVG